jgi:3',5'-cyclic AMP phosphodiesterase CpdA
MHVGDMVDNGREQVYWDSWFDDVHNNWVGDDGGTIPVIPCLGNHENNATNYYEQFALPNNEQWYFYDWGADTRLFVLNSEASSSQISFDQINWLATTLNATPTDKWKIVSFHNNIYYAGAHGNATSLIEWWVPIFDKYHVDIVFQGHDHMYHRSKPMKNNTIVSSYREGTMYMTSGGWGAPLYDYVVQSYSAYGNQTHHFTLISVYGNGTLHLEAKDVNGFTFDEVWVSK